MPTPSRAKRWRRFLPWGSGVALLALTPKCLFCVAAYLGIGAALGLTRPEFCGAAPNSLPAWAWPVAGVSVFGAIGLARRCSAHRRVTARHREAEPAMGR